MKTTKMNEALTAELKRFGWNPARIGTWGRRVDGNPGGVTIEHNGETRYIVGPFTAVHGDDQIAIVRWG